MDKELKEKLIQLFDIARREGMIHSTDEQHSQSSEGDAEDALAFFEAASYRKATPPVTDKELREKIAIQMSFTIRCFYPELPLRTEWAEFAKAEQVALLEQAAQILALVEAAGRKVTGIPPVLGEEEITTILRVGFEVSIPKGARNVIENAIRFQRDEDVKFWAEQK